MALSACQTNVGEVSHGYEVMGLTRAFIFAGTPSVIATPWSVDDRETRLLMEHCYKRSRSCKTRFSTACCRRWSPVLPRCGPRWCERPRQVLGNRDREHRWLAEKWFDPHRSAIGADGDGSMFIGAQDLDT
jgi:CHAT domain